jgi:hypothetical protein
MKIACVASKQKATVFLAESRDRVLTAKDRSGRVNTVRYSKVPTIVIKGKLTTNYYFSSSDRFSSYDSHSLNRNLSVSEVSILVNDGLSIFGLIHGEALLRPCDTHVEIFLK